MGTAINRNLNSDSIASLSTGDLLSESTSPIFLNADLLDQPSGWFGHVPFAHWVVAASRPSVLVELGTHAGVSYAAFCRSVARENIGTRCYAVDTWKGDPHAGHYPEEIYERVRKYNAERYENFSTLLRSTFDEALDHFEDGSVDLLHIDGFHSYEAVQHDFETWQPKLSKRAIVLFHDTNEYQEGFGVWRFWMELREKYPSFEFLHGHGLGVLVYGEEAPATVKALCSLDGKNMIELRSRFQFAGERWLAESRLHKQEEEYLSQVRAAKQETVEALEQMEREQQAQIKSLRADLEALDHAKASLAAEIADLNEELAHIEHTLEALVSSTSWRITEPLRAVKRLFSGQKG